MGNMYTLALVLYIIYIFCFILHILNPVFKGRTHHNSNLKIIHTLPIKRTSQQQQQKKFTQSRKNYMLLSMDWYINKS